ncbi:MAG: YdcF family protein [Candidatus Puniceispirillales bacterium]
MTLVKRTAMIAILLCAVFLTGLQHFVHDIRSTYHKWPDLNGLKGALTGIVVATGGGRRVSTGMDLLHHDIGARLLISGTGSGVSKDDLILLMADGDIKKDRLLDIMSCCVDLGQTAMNTRGNAKEAADWYRQNGFHHIIVVTADYHMPRSLVHFAQALPDADIIPYAVPSYALMESYAEGKRWWAKPSTVIMLSREYGKYLISRIV